MKLEVVKSAQVDIATPEVFIGGLLGAMLVFLFSAWAIIAVGRSAQAVVNEVSFRALPGGRLHNLMVLEQYHA
jgi:Na+/H+-translocating membrane pyrophosphatase